MSEEKQDKKIIKLKNYDQEKEALLQLALEKSQKGERLTESEIKSIRDHFPTEEELKKATESMKGLSKVIQDFIEPQLQIVNNISKSVEQMTFPFTEQVTKIAEGLSESLKPVFEELDLQYKENPLTRKEIEEGTQFFNKYIKDKERLIKEIESLNKRQEKLVSKIFEDTGDTEETILQYKLESEEIDFISNLFIDISKKLQGNGTTREELETQFKKFLSRKIPKNLQEKLKKIGATTEEEMKKQLTEKEFEKVKKASEEIEKEAMLFEKRPSRIELDHLETGREIKREQPLKYILYKSTEIHFENITEEDFKSYLQEEIDILKKAIKIRKTISSYNNEILTIFSRASNPYFEGTKEDELSEEDRNLKEDFYNTSFLLFQNTSTLEKLFSNLFLKRQEFKELDIERQERFFEFLKYTLEDLEDLSKEWNPQKEEIVEEYLVTSEKDRKVLTTEKIVPQLMLSGQKIEDKFLQKQEGKIEKVVFDISSDNDNKYFVEVMMKEYPLKFTEDTFKTLESLMTIQNLMEKQFHRLKGINFSTKDVIYLNKGGRVTNYSKDLLQKTNRELISLMSAIGSLDTTEYFFKYYGIDDKTLEEENEAIFRQINNNDEWEKKLEELRKEKIKREEIKFPFDKIKKISTLQPFVSLKGLSIESDEETLNNTFWKFNDIDEKPIPIFEFLKLTGRFASLPLEMDSYLTDSTINNEVTRNLKTIIANLNYYKNNKSMKKDKTKKNFLEYYFEGTRIKDDEGNIISNPKRQIFQPFEVMQNQKNFRGEWKFKATRTIDSIAKDCKFDEERGIGIPKTWKHNKERPLFVDSIVHYLRKAKEDNNIDDFILYTTKDKVVKNEDYITINEKRTQKTKDKIRGKETKKKQTKNPSIEKISIIIK